MLKAVELLRKVSECDRQRTLFAEYVWKTHLPAGVRDLATGLADWSRGYVSKQGSRVESGEVLDASAGRLDRTDLPFKLITSLMVSVVW